MSCNVTCADPIEAADLYLCAEKLGWRITVTSRPSPHASRYGFRRGPGQPKEVGPRQWIRDAEIAGSKSASKRVPAWVLTAPSEMVAEFLGAYFACDGSVTRLDGDRQGRAIEFYSASAELLADVRSLLARLGIASRLATKTARSGTNFTASEPYESYRLAVTGSDAIARFAKAIDVRHSKGERLRSSPLARQNFESRWLPDAVVAVGPVGYCRCRCLSVAEDQSFVVRDVAAHNSFLGSQWGPAWALDRDPTLRFILSSYGDTLADENADAVREIIRAHAPTLNVALRAGRQALERFRTTAGGGVLSAGIDATLAGFPADVVVLDDPYKNWQQAHSAARRLHVANQFRSELRKRESSARFGVLIVTTRRHEDDLPGELVRDMLSGNGEEYEVVRLAEIAQEPARDDADYYARLPDPLGRKPGEILEPRRFSEQQVAARKLASGSYLWSSMHLQAPAPEEGTEILRAWWKIDDDYPPAFSELIASWDMKLKDKESGDYVAGGVWGRTGSSFWLIALYRGQWNQPTVENAIALAQVREPRISVHIVENTGNGPEVMTALRADHPDYEVSDEIAGLLGMTDDERARVQEIRRRGMTALIPETVKGDKSVRMRAVSGLIEAGNVHLWSRLPGLGAYLDELSAFPNGNHDDQVDMTSQALKRLRGGRATSSVDRGQLPRTPTTTRGPGSDPAVRFGGYQRR